MGNILGNVLLLLLTLHNPFFTPSAVTTLGIKSYFGNQNLPSFQLLGFFFSLQMQY